MDIRNWEQRDSDIALHETNRELESQRLELYRLFQVAQEIAKKSAFDSNSGFAEQGEFFGSSSGASHVLSQPWNFLSPRGMLSRDSRLPLDTRNTMSISGTFMKAYLLEKDHPQLSSRIHGIWHRLLYWKYHGTWKRSETRAAEFVMTSQSIPGRRESPDYDMLDAMIASALKKLLTHVHFRKRVNVEELRAQKDCDSYEEGKLLA